MRTSLLLLLFPALIAELAQALEDQSRVFAQVAPWKIAVDDSMNRGCFIFAEFPRGTFLRIGKDNVENNIYVFVGDPHWKQIEYGRQYPIDISFSDKGYWRVSATGVSFDPPENQPIIGFVVPHENNTAARFLYEFMKESQVEFFFQGTMIARISLENSYQAGLKLMECQRVMNQVNS